MWLTRMAAGLVALAMTGSPVLAKTVVISELGHAPLLGTPLNSTSDLKRHFHEQPQLFAQAGQELGLTQREYERFRVAVETTTPAYVKIPRHLDGMTGYWDGRVHALHDVEIPANQYGWEVDIPERGSTLAVFVPNKCGNVSFVRRVTPHIAARRVVPPPPIARVVPPPAPAAVAAAPVPVEVAAAAAPGAVELPAAAVAHGAGLLPLLGAAVIPFIPLFTGGGGGGTTPQSNTPPPVPLCPN